VEDIVLLLSIAYFGGLDVLGRGFDDSLLVSFPASLTAPEPACIYIHFLSGHSFVIAPAESAAWPPKIDKQASLAQKSLVCQASKISRSVDVTTAPDGDRKRWRRGICGREAVPPCGGPYFLRERATLKSTRRNARDKASDETLVIQLAGNGLIVPQSFSARISNVCVELCEERIPT